ncbi:hypothetical protein DPMN_041729 [Dreissena polymorpha]|uniref:Uncharacterized protein n=1 Tax=Dreissena polymorpha TaxID=45954 RepID=A0A9D4HU65_DREPO|nr:hypothetical protein DPMN_041729 [Dreissena polymorpha]
MATETAMFPSAIQRVLTMERVHIQTHVLSQSQRKATTPELNSMKRCLAFDASKRPCFAEVHHQCDSRLFAAAS